MPDLLTVKQAADFIGITPKAVYLAIDEERIHAVTILGKFGIYKDDALRFKKQRTQPTNGNGNSHK